jgi:hypothetical protein
MFYFTALCAKGPKVGTCPRPPGYFNYDKIFERGTTRLWDRENYRKGKFSLPPVGNLNKDIEKVLTRES